MLRDSVERLAKNTTDDTFVDAVAEGHHFDLRANR
jgi:hypothetical protein